MQPQTASAQSIEKVSSVPLAARLEELGSDQMHAPSEDLERTAQFNESIETPNNESNAKTHHNPLTVDQITPEMPVTTRATVKTPSGESQKKLQKPNSSAKKIGLPAKKDLKETVSAQRGNKSTQKSMISVSEKSVNINVDSQADQAHQTSQKMAKPTIVKPLKSIRVSSQAEVIPPPIEKPQVQRRAYSKMRVPRPMEPKGELAVNLQSVNLDAPSKSQRKASSIVQRPRSPKPTIAVPANPDDPETKKLRVQALLKRREEVKERLKQIEQALGLPLTDTTPKDYLLPQISVLNTAEATGSPHQKSKIKKALSSLEYLDSPIKGNSKISKSPAANEHIKAIERLQKINEEKIKRQQKQLEQMQKQKETELQKLSLFTSQVASRAKEQVASRAKDQARSLNLRRNESHFQSKASGLTTPPNRILDEIEPIRLPGIKQPETMKNGQRSLFSSYPRQQTDEPKLSNFSKTGLEHESKVEQPATPVRESSITPSLEAHSTIRTEDNDLPVPKESEQTTEQQYAFQD